MKDIQVSAHQIDSFAIQRKDVSRLIQSSLPSLHQPLGVCGKQAIALYFKNEKRLGKKLNYKVYLFLFT